MQTIAVLCFILHCSVRSSITELYDFIYLAVKVFKFCIFCQGEKSTEGARMGLDPQGGP